MNLLRWTALVPAPPDSRYVLRALCSAERSTDYWMNLVDDPSRDPLALARDSRLRFLDLRET